MKLPHVALSYGKRLKPARDWLIVLSILLIGLVVSIGWNLWLFGRVSSGVVLGEQPVVPTSEFNQSTLDALAKVFASRTEEGTKYANGTYSFIDPSK